MTKAMHHHLSRRHFLFTSAAGAAALSSTLAASQLPPATPSISLPSPPLAGHILFTADNPGRFRQKAKSHLPQVEVTPDAKAVKTKTVKIKVTTNHEMRPWEHYIVKHQLFDKQMNLLDEHMFNPEKDSKPISEFTLVDYHGPVFVTSVCNKHDTWLSEASV